MSDSGHIINAGISMRPFSIKLDKLDAILSNHEMQTKRKCDCLKDLGNHPAILEIDRKLNCILQLLEAKNMQESDSSLAAKYFPVSNYDDLAKLDKALANIKEKRAIKKYLQEIKGTASTIQSMSGVMKSLFEDDFLTRFVKKSKTQLIDLKVMKLLNDIWCEDNGVSQKEYLTRLHHWMQHNHQNIRPESTQTFDRVDSVEHVEFEFRETNSANVALPALDTPKLGKRKMVGASIPTVLKKVEVVQPEPEPAAPLPAKRIYSPVKIASNKVNNVVELPKTTGKGQVLKVTAENVKYVENMLKNNSKARDAMLAQIKQWKGHLFNIQALDNIMKHLFCNDYLSQFRKNFSQEQNDFLNNSVVVAELRTMWLASGSTAEAFTSVVRYCIQLARSRADSKKLLEATIVRQPEEDKEFFESIFDED